MKKGNAVAVRHDINNLLDELVNKRVLDMNMVHTKVSIVAELIIKAHKKEIKNDQIKYPFRPATLCSCHLYARRHLKRHLL